MIHGVKLIGAMIRDAPSELRIKALDTVCSITKLQVNTLKFTDVLCVSCNIWYKIYDKKNTLLLIFYLIWNCNTVFDNRKKSDICIWIYLFLFWIQLSPMIQFKWALSLALTRCFEIYSFIYVLVETFF